MLISFRTVEGGGPSTNSKKEPQKEKDDVQEPSEVEYHLSKYLQNLKRRILKIAFPVT